MKKLATVFLSVAAIVVIGLIFLVVMSTPAHAADDDKWTGPDKPLHFTASAIVGFSARTFYPNEPLKAFGWGMLPGVIKEFTDNKFSTKDLVVDALGAGLGVYVGGCYINHNSVICGWQF